MTRLGLAPTCSVVHHVRMRWFRKQSQDDGDRLLGLVVEVLDRQDLTWSVIGPDQLSVGNSGTVQMNLGNLRARTAREPADEWPALVADFVGNVLASMAAQREAPLDTSDVDRIAGLLRVRLYPGPIVGGPIEPVARPVVEGIQEILVIDTPTTVMTVSREIAAPWPTPEADLFARARANVRADGPLEVTTDLVPGTRLTALHGETEYVSAHALWTQDYPVTGSEGSLVAVPAEGVIYAHPLEPDPAVTVPAMNAIIQRGWATYSDGHRTISPHIYRARPDGTLIPAASVELAGSTLSVRPTPEFQALLKAT